MRLSGLLPWSTQAGDLVLNTAETSVTLCVYSQVLAPVVQGEVVGDPFTIVLWPYWPDNHRVKEIGL